MKVYETPQRKTLLFWPYCCLNKGATSLIPDQDHQEILEAVEERRTSGECEERLEDDAEFRSFYRGGFVLPSSLANGLGVANSFGILLIMILAASAKGVEYGWGTLRTVFRQGDHRHSRRRLDTLHHTHFTIDTKNCGALGRSIWMRLDKVRRTDRLVCYLITV